MTFGNYHYYSVTSPEGENFIDFSPNKNHGDICYARYNAAHSGKSVREFESNIFHIFISKTWSSVAHSVSHATFTFENLSYIINKFIEAGFPVHYVNQDEYCYTICLHEADYVNRSHLRLFLDFFRAFWEGGLNQVGFKYLSTPQEVRDHYDIILLLQICHLSCYLPAGHGLPCTGSYKTGYIKAEELINYLKKQPRTFNSNLSYIWPELIKVKNPAHNTVAGSEKAKIMKMDLKVKENIDKVINFLDTVNMPVLG